MTELYDAQEAAKLPEQEQQYISLYDRVPTTAAHIIPFSMCMAVGRTADEIWDAMYRCFTKSQELLRFKSQDINSPGNAITMYNTVHKRFGNFELALMETVRQFNQKQQSFNLSNMLTSSWMRNIKYKLKLHKLRDRMLRSFLPEGKILSLNSHDSRYEAPHPLLIKICATVAQILNVTGMGESIEHILLERSSDLFLQMDRQTFGKLLWVV